MDSLLEALLNLVIEILKVIFYVVIWSYVLFFLGVVILKIVTLGKYPVGMQYKKHVNVVAFVGVNALFLLWSSIATYNFSENKYFLIAGLVIATIQGLLIAFKYYSEYRHQSSMWL